VKTRARIAPGQRRLAPEAIPIKAQADRFGGLPDGLSLGQTLAAFKRAAASLGLSAVRDLVDQLMAFSQAQDWQRGSRPIVWPSNAMLADRLGVCQRHVRRLLARLIEAGIIVPMDSPEGRRWGRRDSSGRIVEAYGFDLSPIADRHAEFVAIAEQADGERKARAGLRRRLTIARKAIQQLAETALEHDLADRNWRAWLAEAYRAEANAKGDEGSLEALVAGASELERRREEGEAALVKALQNSVKESSAADSGVRPITTTTEPRADNSATRKEGPQENSRHGDARVLFGQPAALSDLQPPAATPRFVLRVSPPLQEQTFTACPTWADVVDGADRLRHQLGISRAAWIEACQELGRYQAATAVAVIAAKRDVIRSPGGYLRGMIARGRAGDLHLLRSLHGLAERDRSDETVGSLAKTRNRGSSASEGDEAR
jgi:Replication protein C C-terminal region./Replication protein C N-terminal domain.